MYDRDLHSDRQITCTTQSASCIACVAVAYAMYTIQLIQYSLHYIVVSVLFRMYIPAVRPPMLTQYVLCRLHNTLLRSACTKEWTTSIACTRIHLQRLGERGGCGPDKSHSVKQMILLTVYKEVVTPVHCNIAATQMLPLHMLRYLQHYVQLASFASSSQFFSCITGMGKRPTHSDTSLVSRPSSCFQALVLLPIACLTILQAMQSRARAWKQGYSDL